MNEIKNFFESLIPYPLWIKVIIIICTCTIACIYIFYPKRKIGKVDISSLKIIYVQVDSNMYQIGIQAEITNLTNEPISIDKICFKGNQIELISRGVYHLPILDGKMIPFIFLSNEIGFQVIGEKYLKPEESKLYKGLLPLKQDIQIIHGPAFELIFKGGWQITDSDGQIHKMMPRSFGNSNNIVNLSQWQHLNEIDAIMKWPPSNGLISDSVDNFILYNRDRSAEINLYGYCITNYARNEYGTMVIIRGELNPTLKDGWEFLGHNYEEVKNDKYKLQIYNRIFPPGDSLKLKPFATFAGIDLKTDEPSPTTRCTDCITVNVKNVK